MRRRYRKARNYKKRRWIVSQLRVTYKGRRFPLRSLRKMFGEDKALKIWRSRKKYHRSTKGKR
jgi:hypothetical protein